MKKSIVIILAGIMMLSAVACSSNNNSDTSSSNNNSSSTSVSDNTSDSKTAESPLELLNTVWSSFSDDEKFPVAGGDLSEENNNMEGPGKYSLDDAESVESVLGLPKDCIDKVSDSASLVHLMNANTFTCSAFRVKDSKDVDDVANAIRDNLLKRQWICGMPDKLVIFTDGQDIVSVFGEKDLVDDFKGKMTASFSSAKIASEDNISQ